MVNACYAVADSKVYNLAATEHLYYGICTGQPSKVSSQRPSVTAQGPGHDNDILLGVAAPVHSCVPDAVGPETSSEPSLLTLPL